MRLPGGNLGPANRVTASEAERPDMQPTRRAPNRGPCVRPPGSRKPRGSCLSRRNVSLLAGALVTIGCACSHDRPPPTQDVSGLVITRYRYQVDEKRGVTRVVAEIRNAGDKHVSAATVTAILLGPGGENRGENRTVVRDLKPGQCHTFSLIITSHGRERDVGFVISPGDSTATRPTR